MDEPRLIRQEPVAGDIYTRLTAERLRRQDAKPERVRQFYADPLGFVMWNWRWGLPGSLERSSGPDTWQQDVLIEIGEEVRSRQFNGRDPVTPIREGISSGHGIGKSSLAAMITTWLMSTRPFAKGTVTANTFNQLETKTWATIEHWFKSGRTAKDFIIGGNGIRHKIHGKSWWCSPQTSADENSEAFAGQHAADSTSFYIVDESSAISDKIWEVIEGGLTDGEPHVYAFGNPTRATGKFFRICFGDERKRWNSRVIDSRECKMTNKVTLQEWVDDYGEDSDFVRVRVRGLPPRAGDMQYIDSETVYAAQKRLVEVLDDEPLVAGVDLARGGGDNAVIRFRRGDDARSIKPIKIPSEVTRNSMHLVAKLADLASQVHGGRKVHTWFLDGTGIGGPIIDRMVQLGHANFIEVQFGGRCPDDKHIANMRAYMWSKMRDWMKGRGAIDKDKVLETDLTNQGLGKPDKTDRIVLESKQSMKKRGLASPDDGDALALTFAHPVLVESNPRPQERDNSGAWGSGSENPHTQWMGSLILYVLPCSALHYALYVALTHTKLFC